MSGPSLPRVLIGLAAALAIASGAARLLSAEASSPAAAQADPLADAIAFVERERGLRFRAPVRIVRLDHGAFRREVSKQARANIKRPANRAAFELLEALGLLPAGSDLHRAFGHAGSGGFYDARRHRLVVAGTDDGPAARAALVHELTHALDDQWFGIYHPVRRDDGAAFAFATLAEGNARRVELAYLATLSPADRRRAEGHEPAPSNPTIPPAVSEMLAAPYTLGPAFVEHLIATGSLDAAFREPPTTAWEVLFPGQHRRPATAPHPRADGRARHRGVLGAYRLAMLAGGTNQPAALAAAHAWADDHYVTWRERGRTCARVNIAAADVAGAQAITTALGRWKDGRIATHASRVTLTSCR